MRKFSTVFNSVFITVVIIIFSNSVVFAQWPVLPSGKPLNPSDPSEPYSLASFYGHRYNMVNGELYTFGLKGGVAFGQTRHQFMADVPFVRSSVAGIEDLVGIGDVTFTYKGIIHELPEGLQNYKTSTFFFDLSLPTGNRFDGHGTGSLVGIPGFIFAFKPIQEVGIYPKIWYIHSFKNVSGEFIPGYPNTISSDPDANNEKKIRNLNLEVLFTVELPSQSWIGAAPMYSREMVNNDNTLSVRPELGKLFSENWLIKLNSVFYIAGRRRLLNWIGFDLNYYFL